MAHFAELDAFNRVIQVVVIDNNDCLDVHGRESEQVGIDFCKNLYGQDTKWIQTSYNGNFRSRYAGIGDTYDPQRDLFVPDSPFRSWIYDHKANNWNPPIPYPSDGKEYYWDEDQVAWIEVGK